jgi:hypothetical protein
MPISDTPTDTEARIIAAADKKNTGFFIVSDNCE